MHKCNGSLRAERPVIRLGCFSGELRGVGSRRAVHARAGQHRAIVLVVRGLFPHPNRREDAVGVSAAIRHTPNHFAAAELRFILLDVARIAGDEAAMMIFQIDK